MGDEIALARDFDKYPSGITYFPLNPHMEWDDGL